MGPAQCAVSGKLLDLLQGYGQAQGTQSGEHLLCPLQTQVLDSGQGGAKLLAGMVHKVPQNVQFEAIDLGAYLHARDNLKLGACRRLDRFRDSIHARVISDGDDLQSFCASHLDDLGGCMEPIRERRMNVQVYSAGHLGSTMNFSAVLSWSPIITSVNAGMQIISMPSSAR